jgi:tripartite-type tricarboxylate transporter receptor subunit TctC
LAAGAATLPAFSRIAKAQGYPTKPVHLIVGFPAGGTADIAARLIGQWLSERLGQPFIIENRPGANTSLAAEAVVRAPGDGHTLLLVSPSHAINATVYDRLSYNFIGDIAMAAGVTRTPLVLEVNPALAVRTVPDLIAYARANPGKLSLASYGTGSISHVGGELFKIMAGVEMVHVPYRGSAPLLPDFPASIEHIRSAKLRPLALTTAVRSEALPGVPTLAEFLPSYEASAWSAVGAPKRTPAEIVEKLNKAINACLADPEVKARLAVLGAVPFPGSPADLDRHIAEDAYCIAARQADMPRVVQRRFTAKRQLAILGIVPGQSTRERPND